MEYGNKVYLDHLIARHLRIVSGTNDYTAADYNNVGIAYYWRYRQDGTEAARRNLEQAKNRATGDTLKTIESNIERLARNYEEAGAKD